MGSICEASWNGAPVLALNLLNYEQAWNHDNHHLKSSWIIVFLHGPVAIFAEAFTVEPLEAFRSSQYLDSPPAGITCGTAAIGPIATTGWIKRGQKETAWHFLMTITSITSDKYTNWRYLPRHHWGWSSATKVYGYPWDATFCWDSNSSLFMYTVYMYMLFM